MPTPMKKPYRDLNPRTELEQSVYADLKAALEKRGATVTHYGTPASHAPSTAPCDICFVYGAGPSKQAVMVEVAQRNEASEFQSIVSHLDSWVHAHGPAVNLIYSGRSTSARMARLLRNENERREAKGIAGRIVFLKLDDLENYLAKWTARPSTEVAIASLEKVFASWTECTDDLTSSEIFRRELFPDWEEKRVEINIEKEQRLIAQQERLKKDIKRLENQLRDRGHTGQRAHKYLIYLFFMALYEDKRGMKTRATRSGFVDYAAGIPSKSKADPEFRDRTVHHLLSQEILADPEISAIGIPTEYVRIDLPDEFVLKNIIPVFENYSFADASIDAIGAVFEALARRAEKDNRIGQFFTPETAVAAACRLAGLKPTDIVADPACGTGRFLIRAMANMISQADQVPGRSREQVEKAIKQQQLLGCDIDPWVSVIAKMNMYIHGDGKSNIRHANGLSISSITTFAPAIPGPVVDHIDVVVTNPPLGDIDFMAVADQVARELALTSGASLAEADLKKSAAEWSSGVFDVVPHRIQEEDQRDIAKQKAEEYLEKSLTAAAEGKARVAAQARTRYEEWDKKREAAEKAIGSGKITYLPSGRTAKGGALFISSLVQSLKKIRDASLPSEWKGGILSMIIDEAVLNTREYSSARAFIRQNFFVKSIASLPREAFADLAKTTAKTSILLLVRKDDPAVQQREPVFFARAFATGPAGRDITRPNDLLPIGDAFDRWRTAVLAECAATGGGALPTSRLPAAIAAMRLGLPPNVQANVRALDPGNQEERLDEAYWTMKDLVDQIAGHVPLSNLADLIDNGRTPPEKSVYLFAFASSVDVRVRPKGAAATEYSASALQQLQKGDILVSGIDLVRGAVGVVGADCEGMVVSKEFYILRPKDGVDAHWLVALLRTPAVRRIIEGTVTGTSNRTRVESPDVLMSLPLPPVPSTSVQSAVGELLRKAHMHQSEMQSAISSAETTAAQESGLAVLASSEEATSEETA